MYSLHAGTAALLNLWGSQTSLFVVLQLCYSSPKSQSIPSTSCPLSAKHEESYSEINNPDSPTPSLTELFHWAVIHQGSGRSPSTFTENNLCTQAATSDQCWSFYPPEQPSFSTWAAAVINFVEVKLHVFVWLNDLQFCPEGKSFNCSQPTAAKLAPFIFTKDCVTFSSAPHLLCSLDIL